MDAAGVQDYVEEWWHEAATYETATPITLTLATPDVIGSDFTLELGGTISGHIYENDGTTPITSSAWVNVEDPITGAWLAGQVLMAMVVTPSLGYLLGTTGFVPKGLAVLSNITTMQAQTATMRLLSRSQLERILQISTSRSIQEVTIPGTVYEIDGITPVPNMRVDAEGVWVGTCTDVDGHYTLYNQPLSVPLKVSTGSNNWCGGGQNYLEAWWQRCHQLRRRDTDCAPRAARQIWVASTSR